MDIRTIIRLCGGARQVAAASALSQRSVARKTVYSWISNGIPEWHWELITRMSGVTAEQIHMANRTVSSRKAKPSEAAA